MNILIDMKQCKSSQELDVIRNAGQMSRDAMCKRRAMVSAPIAKKRNGKWQQY